jgi:ABC-type transporter Mla subunit MlaD
MERELEQLLKEMTSELKDLVRYLRGSSKAVIEGTKSIKQENSARKMAIQALEKQREDLKARGKLTKELNKEIDESIESLNKFQKSAKAGVGVFGLVTKSLKFLKDAVVSVATAGIKTGLAFSDTTKQISSVGDFIDAGFGEIPGLGKVTKELAREIDSNVESFSQLAKTGGQTVWFSGPRYTTDHGTDEKIEGHHRERIR